MGQTQSATGNRAAAHRRGAGRASGPACRHRANAVEILCSGKAGPALVTGMVDLCAAGLVPEARRGTCRLNAQESRAPTMKILFVTPYLPSPPHFGAQRR